MFDHIYQTRGAAAAYQAACDRLREKEAELNALWDSRFMQLRTLGDGRKKLWPVTEGFISRTYDLADLDGPDEAEPQFFYVEDDGSLHPVTLGRQVRSSGAQEDAPTNVALVYGSSSLVANGKVVGQVLYTDH